MERTLEKRVVEDKWADIVPQGAEYQPIVYAGEDKVRLYGGYLNKSEVDPMVVPQHKEWRDLGRGIFGMYVPGTEIITLNSELLSKNIHEYHVTGGHEALHKNMKIPDGYQMIALEAAMFQPVISDDGYYPPKF